jgi:hypothetical protein
MMKKLFTEAIWLILLTLGVLGSACAQSDSPACNNKLIAGNYGFTVNGTKFMGPEPTGLQVGVAMAEFDGKGSFTQVDTVTINGEVVADFSHAPANGTYTVNPDCTGTFTINFTDGRPPVETNFVVVQDGEEIDTVVTSAGEKQGILATGSVGKRRSCRHRRQGR